MTCARCSQLAAIVAELQRELLQTMGPAERVVIQALQQGPASVAELSERHRRSIPATKQILFRLEARGWVQRIGWKDRPGSPHPSRLFQLAPAGPAVAHERSNGARP